MKISPCQEAFNSGQAWRCNQRKTHPMQFSRYKIVETGKRWSDYPTELRNIGRCAGGVDGACYALRHCVQEDESKWVEHLPESMLEGLSRNCGEVLYALHGDGVPQKTIDTLELMVRAQVPRLISLGEEARLEAKHDWRRLTKSLASGNGCVVSEFVGELQSLVASLIDQIGKHVPNGLRPSETTSKSVTTKTLIDSGLALVGIPYGQKAPAHSGWNLRQNCITDSSGAARLEGMNIGLAHAYCAPVPSCAIDIDNYKTAKPWLAMHGIELDALLKATGAVLISSGRKFRIKLLYRLPAGSPPLESKKIIGPDGQTALELRCATKDGKTVQDVLPPSRHPDGLDYVWVGDGNPLLMPEIPRALLDVWHQLITNTSRVALRSTNGPMAQHPQPETPRQIAKLQAALSHIRADCSYEVWRNIVWAILSTNWSCAEEIAEEWSRTAPDRYSEEAFWTLVNSYMPELDNPITAGTIYYRARLGGWHG